ncbi:5399_t:CDS:2 [Paraglomus occultum]|uniref:5399_t:CDS:1 n=1 Tax=Paraglomus occultum TaxID=144539 RepID=A0A9N9B018_9GLOM|nr:5399_t:CDS:2 [Paraglomus occultum]
MVYTYTTNVNKDEVDLKRGAYCYGLPYGYFGLICWGLSILAIALTYANITLFTFWRGCRPYYKSQSGWMALVAATMTLGPTIYTCYHCSGDYTVMLLAIGQLTPWGFKMLNDGARGSQTTKAPPSPHGKSSSAQSVNTYPGSDYDGYAYDQADQADTEKPTDADKSRDKAYIILGVRIYFLLKLLAIGVESLKPELD